MCTLVVFNEVHNRYPLIIAANRDELYSRPSSPPEQSGSGPFVVSPRDLQRGGTWMGAVTGGWFAGITNQDDGTHLPGKKSRGSVVDMCLQLAEHGPFTRYLTTLEPNDYNPFNLVFGRLGAMFLAKFHGGQVEIEHLQKGIHVVSNDHGPNRSYQRKVNHVTALASTVDNDDGDTMLLHKLLTTLSDHFDHGLGPYSSACVHADEDSFGTRSTSVVLFDHDGGVKWFYSEGHPCKNAKLDVKFNLLHMDFSDLEETELDESDFVIVEENMT